jgi:hypothetical protein
MLERKKLLDINGLTAVQEAKFEDEIGTLCYKYGLNVDFDYIVKD